MKGAALVLCLFLAGCGQGDKALAMLTGQPAEVCVRGVVYYQFYSGAAPGYRPDGSLLKCQ